MKIVMEGTDQRVYNQPTADEIAALLSDDNVAPATRDVIAQVNVDDQSCRWKAIFPLHAAHYHSWSQILYRVPCGR